MAFVDMVYLRRENICDGMIHYVRRKTGQEIVIGRYTNEDHSYVFPILKSANPEKMYAETGLRCPITTAC